MRFLTAAMLAVALGLTFLSASSVGDVQREEGSAIILYPHQGEIPSLPDERPPLAPSALKNLRPLAALSAEFDFGVPAKAEFSVIPKTHPLNTRFEFPSSLFLAGPTRHAGGIFQRLPDGRFLWAGRIHAEGWNNHYLEALIDDIALPQGSALWAFGTTRGSYEASFPYPIGGSIRNTHSGPILGPDIYLQVVFPAGALPRARPFGLTLRSVRPELKADFPSHADKALQHPFACFKDAMCIDDSRFPGIDKYRRGIVYLRHPNETPCTGSLIKSHRTKPRKKGVSYILTALHCVKSQEEAKNLDIYFNYHTDRCGGTAPVLDKLPNRIRGARLALKFFSNNDYSSPDLALLEVKDKDLPPDRHYFDWNQNEMITDPGEMMARLSHPRPAGYTSLPLTYSESRITSTYVPYARCHNLLNAEISHRVYGDIWIGSSGSPLLTMRGYIAGHAIELCNRNSPEGAPFPRFCGEGTSINVQVDTTFSLSMCALDSFIYDRQWTAPICGGG